MPIFRVKLRRTVVEETTVYVEAERSAHIYNTVVEADGEETSIECHADNTSTWEGDVEEIEVVSTRRVEKSPGPPVCKLHYEEE